MSHRFMYQNRLSSAVTITPRSMAQGVVGGAVPRVANGSGGVIFTGPYTGDGQRVYTVEIDLAGDVGTATFKWRTTDTAVGSWEASGVLTALTDVTLNAGVKVRFTAGAGTDFSLGDRWECTASNRFGKRFLYDLDPNQRFRTGTPSDPEFVAFDLLTAQEVKAAVVHLHNISSGAATKIQGGPVPQDYALRMNASTNTGVLTVADAAAIQDIFAGGGAVEAWAVISTGVGAAAGHRIICKQNAAFTRGWALRFTDDSGGLARIEFVHIFAGTAGVWRTTDRIITMGSWYKVRLEYNADAAGNDPTLKVTNAAGTETTYTVGSGLTETSTPAGALVSDAGDDLLLGNGPGAPSNNQRLDGFLDEAVVEATIGSTRIHLKMDEGSGTTAADSSGNGHNGTLSGDYSWTTSVHSPLDETVTWRAGTMFRYLTTAGKTHRHWRLLITGDSGNPDGWIEIGELYLGDHFEPAEDFRWNSVPAGEEAVERRQETESGTPRDVLLNRLRSARLGYEHLADAQVASFRAMFQAVKDAANGRNLPLFAHLAVDDGGESLRLYRLGASLAPLVEGPDDNALEIELLERGT